MKKVLLIFSLFSFSFFSCFTAKKQGTSSEIIFKEGALNIEQAYLQKEVPGQKNEETIQYLTLVLERLSNQSVKLDSLHFEERTYSLPASSRSSNNRQTIRLQLKTGIQVNAQKTAVIFYTDNEQALKQTVPLSEKSPIYLP